VAEEEIDLASFASICPFIVMANPLENLMATVLKPRVDLKAFAKEVRARANAQHETPQSKRLYAVRFNPERARAHSLQRSHWTSNRRDCWAYAQAVSPMAVKKLIWAHEEDELNGNRARGVEDHHTLRVRESAAFGLTPEDFVTTPMNSGTRTCTYAWLHLARYSHWLTAVSSSCALEISNSTEWVDGGGGSYRLGKQYERDLGIPFHKQLNAKEHAEVDVEHAHILMQIAERHATTPELIDLMLKGLIESWEIESVWKGLMVDMLEEIPGPR
jgi:hypothetical protein